MHTKLADADIAGNGKYFTAKDDDDSNWCATSDDDSHHHCHHHHHREDRTISIPLHYFHCKLLTPGIKPARLAHSGIFTDSNSGILPVPELNMYYYYILGPQLEASKASLEASRSLAWSLAWVVDVLYLVRILRGCLSIRVQHSKIQGTFGTGLSVF